MPQFICPYCFNKIDTREICFRCINPNPKDCPLQEDVPFSKYWQLPTTRPMARIIKPNLPFYKHLVTYAVCPDCKTKSTKMICPICHNPLPHTVGLVKDYTVALIGAKDAGKSHYIAVLINALAQHVGQKLNASLVALNDETITRYRDEFYKPLYEKKEIIKGTVSAGATGGLKHPLMYRFSIGRESLGGQKHTVVTLVFFDTAGEDFDYIDRMRAYLKYITNASGIIFILDPLQIPAVRDRLPEDTKKHAIHTQPEDIVTRVINLIRENNQTPANTLIDIPVALAFSKIDALRCILYPDSKLNQASPHGAYFDVNDCELVNSEMQAYLEEWIGPGLNSILEHNFQQFAYFGLSALGAPPSGNNLTETVSSFRIGDPFLWLLWKNDLIKGKKVKT